MNKKFLIYTFLLLSNITFSMEQTKDDQKIETSVPCNVPDAQQSPLQQLKAFAKSLVFSESDFLEEAESSPTFAYPILHEIFARILSQ